MKRWNPAADLNGSDSFSAQSLHHSDPIRLLFCKNMKESYFKGELIKVCEVSWWVTKYPQWFSLVAEWEGTHDWKKFK